MRSLAVTRPVLVSNLMSGAVLVLPPAALDGWLLSLIGAAHIVASSLFFERVYSRASLTRGQEVVAWIVPWAVGVAIWTEIVSGPLSGDGSDPGLGVALFGAACIETILYLLWQLGTLAARQFLTWSAGAPPLVPSA